MIDQATIQKIFDAADIYEVVSDFVSLKKRGVNYLGLCPFHNEKTGSFTVSPAKGIYKCFGCGKGGNAVNFIMEHEQMSYVEALKYLAEKYHIPVEEKELTEEQKKEKTERESMLIVSSYANEYFQYQLWNTDEGRSVGLGYLRQRGISDEMIRKFGLGYNPEGWGAFTKTAQEKGYKKEFLVKTGLTIENEKGLFDRFRARVMFPVLDLAGKVIAFGGRTMTADKKISKYLNSPETKLFDKSRNLYGLNYARLSREGYLLICEGYLDVISLHQAGFTNAVASLGTAFTSQHANVLKRYTDQVILTYDSDGAGVKAALRAIPILKEVGMSIKVLNMKPYKDPDEFIKNMGAEAFRQRIREAKNSFLFEVDVLRRGYEMDDPEQKTRFYQETARKLLQFGEALERENYLQAVAREQMIPAEELRGLVNRMGMSMGLKAGESLNHSGRVVPQETQEESGGSGLSGSRKPRRPDKEDGIRRSQRLLLTWLIETPALFEKIEGIITADDFVEHLYHQVAQMVFDGHREGNLNPAAILSRFINDEDQYKEVAALFNASLKESLNNEEQKKAFSETVMKVRKNSLDVASRNAKDITQLQEIIRQQAALKQLHISLD